MRERDAQLEYKRKRLEAAKTQDQKHLHIQEKVQLLLLTLS